MIFKALTRHTYRVLFYNFIEALSSPGVRKNIVELVRYVGWSGQGFFGIGGRFTWVQAFHSALKPLLFVHLVDQFLVNECANDSNFAADDPELAISPIDTLLVEDVSTFLGQVFYFTILKPKLSFFGVNFCTNVPKFSNKVIQLQYEFLVVQEFFIFCMQNSLVIKLLKNFSNSVPIIYLEQLVLLVSHNFDLFFLHKDILEMSQILFNFHLQLILVLSGALSISHSGTIGHLHGHELFLDSSLAIF